MIATVGDAPKLVWELRDPDSGERIDATVTCAVTTAPTGGATGALTVVREAQGRYAVLVPLTVVGDWLGTWTASGPVTAVDGWTITAVAAADPAWQAPGWAPTLRDVGSHIPTRTRELGTDDRYTGMFSDSTEPTADAVTVLIRDACTWAAGPLGAPVQAVTWPLLRLASALYAAYSVELAYPERDADVRVYEQLLTQAESIRATADQTNAAAGGGTEVDVGGDQLLGSHSFPPAPCARDIAF
jgi:hypothetical protein